MLGRVLGRVPEKGDCWEDCWEQCREATFSGKNRETALLPAVLPAVPFFPALFPALSPALLGDSGFLSPVAGGPDYKFRSLKNGHDQSTITKARFPRSRFGVYFGDRRGLVFCTGPNGVSQCTRRELSLVVAAPPCQARKSGLKRESRAGADSPDPPFHA